MPYERLGQFSPEEPTGGESESLANPDTEAEQKEHHTVREVTKLLAYDLNGTTERKIVPASEEQMRKRDEGLNNLPQDIIDAIYAYAEMRDLEMWKEETQNASNQASVRISSDARGKAHDAAAAELVKYDKTTYPDIESGREAIKGWFQELTSKDVAEERRDNLRAA